MSGYLGFSGYDPDEAAEIRSIILEQGETLVKGLRVMSDPQGKWEV